MKSANWIVTLSFIAMFNFALARVGTPKFTVLGLSCNDLLGVAAIVVAGVLAVIKIWKDV